MGCCASKSPHDLFYPPVELRQSPLSNASNAVKTTEFAFEDVEVIKLVGTGGFGKVECVKLRQSCGAWAEGALFAIKTLSKGNVIGLRMSSSAISEILVCSACNSPFIATFHAAWSRPEDIHLVMELLPGGELYATYTRESLHGNEKCAVFYIACVSLGLLHLHGMAVVSRGIKPEDVCLDARGYPKLVDMGLAKQLADHGGRTYTMCGTPDYIPPEVIMSHGHGVAFDWWATGVLAFELLAGNPPFASDTPMQIYPKITKDGIGKVTFPDAVKKAKGASELVKALCEQTPEKRLPMKKDGWMAYRNHAFFSDLDWTAIENRSLTPPFVPTMSGPEDMSNFSEMSTEDLPRVVPIDSCDSDGTTGLNTRLDELLKAVVD